MADAGVVGADAEIEFNVTVSTGDTITMDACEAGKNWYHLKLSRFSDLQPQFENYRIAHSRFPSMAPEALAYRKVSGWSILMCRSIYHKALRVADLDESSRSTRLGNELVGFFEQARMHSQMDDQGSSHAGLFRDLRTYFFKTNQIDSRVLEYLEQSDQTIWRNSLYIPQHGDFVLNNLGVADGNLAVFDWEDYGATGLVGFDICMLCMSLGGMCAETAIALHQSESPAGKRWAIAERACAASGLPYTVFRRGVPTYLIIFRYLKRNYGSAIRQKIDDILKQLLI